MSAFPESGWWTYPLKVFVCLFPKFTILQQYVSRDDTQRCGTPAHPLLALAVLVVSSVQLSSRSLSFKWVGLYLLLGGGRRLSHDCTLPEEYLIHNLDGHCLIDTGAVWCLTYPSRVAPFHRALRFLVVREA